MDGALNDIKIVEVTTMAAAPMAARLLADWGADVVHIEHPQTGDPWRTWIKKPDGSLYPPEVSYHYWEHYNRNKRSMSLDISQEQGREIIYRLLKNADVFITNRRPAELRRFRLDYASIKKTNKRLVYASLTGFGKKGPDKDAPGHDTVGFWARSGFMYLLQQAGSAPPSPGYRTVAAGDTLTGVALALGITMALLARQKTGLGQEVDVSLLNMGIFANVPAVMSLGPVIQVLGGKKAYTDMLRRERHDVSPLFISYETKDKRWLQLSLAPPEPYWAEFCRAIGREEMAADSRFSSAEARTENKEALFRTLEDVFRTRTLAQWKAAFKKTSLIWSPIQRPDEAVRDPQARANGIFVPFQHPGLGRMRVVANPVRLSRTPASVRTPAPEFNQHTEEILLELGYDWESIARLKREKVIA